MSQLHFEWAGQMLITYITGEVDHHAAVALRKEIDREILHKAPAHLVLDLGGVSFMDSSGVGLILGRYKLMETFAGSMALQNPPLPIRRMLALSGVDALVEVTQGGKNENKKLR